MAVALLRTRSNKAAQIHASFSDYHEYSLDGCRNIPVNELNTYENVQHLTKKNLKTFDKSVRVFVCISNCAMSGVRGPAIIQRVQR